MRITVYRETAGPVDGESGEPTAVLEAVRLAVEHLQPEEAVWAHRRNGLDEKLAGKDCLLVVAPYITRRQCQLLEQLSSPPVVVVTLDPRAAALDLCRVQLWVWNLYDKP